VTAISKPVEDRATAYLERICGKPLASIKLTHDFAAETVIPAELVGSPETTVGVERMSGGEKEQIWLCTRMALAMELARQEGQFLLLDDILTSTDSGRMLRICDLLAELAERMQVIVFTCHPERFASISDARLIDVEALSRPQRGIADVAA
jgi:exonuclease SbcC